MKVLGVDKNADDAALKKAYRDTCKKISSGYEPGKMRTAEKKFKEASEAYAVT